MEDAQSPDRTALKQPLDVKFVSQTSDGLVNYKKTWLILRKKAAEHANRTVLILHQMMRVIALEDEA